MRAVVPPARIQALIHAAYDAVDDDEHWSPFAAGVAEVLPGCGVVVRAAGGGRGEGVRFAYAGVGPDLIRRQRADEIIGKPWTDRFLRLEGRCFDEALALDRLFDQQAFLASGYDRAFVDPGQIYDARAVILGEAHDLRVTILPRGRPAMAAAAGALLDQLLPHLKRVRELRGRRQEAETWRTVLQLVLDRLSIAVLVLNPDGRVQAANRAAIRLTESAGEVLVDGSGRLRCAEAGAQRRLDQSLARVAGRVRQVQAQPASIVLGREGGRRPLVLSLSPVALAGGPRRAELVLAALVDLEGSPSSAALGKAALALGLTPAESRLVGRLAAGSTLVQAARELGISWHTARNQLRSAMEKSGVQRQIDLIRAILAGGGFDMV